MIAPRTINKKADGRLCEEDDPESAFLVIARGQMMSDGEAQRIGLTAYLEQPVPMPTVAPETKAVAQEDTENKAVDQTETEDKGSQTPESRRRRA